MKKDPYLVSVMIWAGAVLALFVWWIGGVVNGAP